jgi:prophage antirepressor-like protein
MSAMNIVPFQFETQEVRAIIMDDEPWWLLVDVCRTLQIVNTTDAANRLEADEQKSLPRATLGLGEGGAPMRLVNTPGIFRLITRSDKPVAKRFQHWLFHEVLPSIQKTGSYSLAKPGKMPTNFDALRQLVDLAEEHESRIRNVETAVENFGAHQKYRTIIGHANLMGLKISGAEAQKLGIRAARLSKSRGIIIEKRYDDRHGTVNSYHIDILNELFRTGE